MIEKYKKAEGNIKEKILRKLSDESKENHYLIHTIVVEGNVHRARSYGWFGTYDEKKKENEWKEEYLKLLENHKNDFMVNLDCHI